MQAKDISTDAVLRFLLENGGIGCYCLDETTEGNDRNVKRIFEAPAKVVRAKLRKLIHQKLINGCCCGCRGDFELADTGKRYLEGEA